MAEKTTIISNGKLRVFEMFSGIGAQHKALQNIKRKNPKMNYEIVATSEWDINAIISYDSIHNGFISADNLKIMFEKLWKKYSKKYKNLDLYLKTFNFSKDGKNRFADINSLNDNFKKRLFIANVRTKNLGDITCLKNKDLPNCDILTYSFPCQDLSIANMGRQKGMEKNSGTRSGLLWEVENILIKYEKCNKKPSYLILENVGNMLSKKFKPQYDEWIHALDKLGYQTKTFAKGLDARSFGIPQKRKRIFAISFLKQINFNDLSTLETNEKMISDKEYLFKKFLIGSNYRDEINKCMVNMTPSRLKMISENPVWNTGVNTKNIYQVPTITTKQDRNPNSGFLKESGGYRFLTPRETLLLMGFQNRDFENIKSDCHSTTNSILYKQAGNSIVVPILEKIFQKIAVNKGAI